MNKKFDFINNPKEFKEKVKEEELELKKRIKKFLETDNGREFIYKSIDDNEKLKEYLQSIYGIRGRSGPIGATGVQGYTGVVGYTGISQTEIQGVTGVMINETELSGVTGPYRPSILQRLFTNQFRRNRR